MENAIEVKIAKVTMDISPKDDMTMNGKSPNKNFLLEQNHQPVCTICNEWDGMNIICCSECYCKIYDKCLLLPSYQYTWANCTPANVYGIKPRSCDIEINELKENLNEIVGINTLLRKEDEKRREKNSNS